jgi:putative serine protease PepD
MSVQTLERPPELPPPPDPAPPAAAGSGGGGGRRGWRRRLVTVAAIASLGIGSGLAGGYVASGLEDQPAATVAAAPVTTGTTGGDTSSLAKVAAAVAPSVVSITVRTAGQQVEGSGVVLTSDGLIVTNAHVVSDAAGGRITVDLSDGRKVAATVVGTDQATDLAVIQAEGVSGLKAATFGDSDALEVGDTVLAVGNSLGLEGSVTAGIVSALHRSLETDGGGSLGDAIQTDASINPGNSGGPLVNAAGQVVGITTANASVDGQSSGSIGVGFAIPANTVEQVVNQPTGGVHTVSASATTG